MSTDSQSALGENDLHYAGFWLRLCAMLLDAVIALPAALPLLLGKSVNLVALGLASSLLFEVFIEVYVVQRFGGSPGKLIMGLRIVKPDGSRITYREAILRCAPDVIFEVVACLALASMYSQLTQLEHTSASVPNPASLEPAWSQASGVLQNIWRWGELLVLLTNKKRRALHDFIAGTVVVVIRRPGRPEKGPLCAASAGI